MKLVCLIMFVLALPSCATPRDSLALREVLECSKGHSNVTMKFYSKVIPPQGSAIITEGEAVWSRPMLLIGHYETPFSGDRYFVRLDKEAWLYHETVRDWVTAAEMGVPEIGLNWTNPQFVFDILLTCIKDSVVPIPAISPSNVPIEVELNPQAIDITGLVKMLPELAEPIEHEKVTGKLTFVAEPSTVTLLKFKFEMRLATKNSGSFWTFQGFVDLSRYSQSQPMQFMRLNARTGKPESIPFPKVVADSLPLHFGKSTP